MLVVRPLLLRVIRRFGVSQSALPLDLMGILLAAVFVSGMTTYAIGIFAIFGGFSSACCCTTSTPWHRRGATRSGTS